MVFVILRTFTEVILVFVILRTFTEIILVFVILRTFTEIILLPLQIGCGDSVYMAILFNILLPVAYEVCSKIFSFPFTKFLWKTVTLYKVILSFCNHQFIEME